MNKKQSLQRKSSQSGRIEGNEKINKRVDKIPQELRRIMVDTNKRAEKKSSTELLKELRYGGK